MTSYAACLARARSLSSGTRRVLLGIAGAPGSGKTTLAERLVADLDAERPGSAVHVPMDGFHLADVTLERHGSRTRKGAIDTFDGFGYDALLGRLAVEPQEPVFAPGFDRTLEQPVAGSIEIGPEVRFVASEGNYLLVDDDPWRAVAARFDEVWFCETDDAVRRERLVDRHVRFGKTRREAEEWVREVDEPNAALITRSRSRAAWVVRAG